MYTLYRLNADDLDEGFLQSLKTLFKGQTIEIAVSGAEDASEDETAFLLRDPANGKRLLEALENVRRGEIVTPAAVREEEEAWSHLSLEAAMRGMEDEKELYTLADVRKELP